MVTITYAPLGSQCGAMQSLHYVRDDATWLNMITNFLLEKTVIDKNQNDERLLDLA